MRVLWVSAHPEPFVVTSALKVSDEECTDLAAERAAGVWTERAAEASGAKRPR